MLNTSEKLRVRDEISHEERQNSQLGLIEPRELDVVSVGEFGRAVARCLREGYSGLHEFTGPLSAVILREAAARTPAGKSAVIVVASHPAQAICESFARLAHESGRPFLPVVIDESVLRLGPVIVPGVSSCWRCWMARYRQHDNHPRETEALHAFYNDHPEGGPRGYWEPFVWIMSSQLAAILDSAQSLRQWAGKLWQLHLFSREVTAGELIGVDGCSCCGLNRPLSSRNYSEMQRSLAYLWAGSSNPDIEKWIDKTLKAHSACEGDSK